MYLPPHLRANYAKAYRWMLDGLPDRIEVNASSLKALNILTKHSTGKNKSLKKWKEYIDKMKRKQ